MGAIFNQLFRQQQLCFCSAPQELRDVYHKLRQVLWHISSTCFWNRFLVWQENDHTRLKKKGLSFSLQLQCLSVIFPYLQSWRRCLVTREQHSSVQGQGLLLPRPRSPQWVKVQQSPHRDALSARCFTYTSIPKRLKTITWIRQWTSAWDSGKMRSPIGGFCEKAMNLYAGRLTAVRWWGVVWLP